MQTRYIRMSNPAGEVARVKRTKNTYGQYNDEADTLGWNNSTINKLRTTYKILDASTNAEVACTGDAANKSIYLDDPVFNKLYKIDLTTCITENNRETLNLFSIVKYNMKTSPGVYNFKVKAYIKIVDNDNIEYVYGENSNLTVYNYIFRSEFCHTRSVKSAHLFFTIIPDIDGAVMDIDSLQFYQIMLARHYNEANTKEFKLKELAISKKTEIITKADDNVNKYYSTSVIEQSFAKDDSMNDVNSNSVSKRTGNNGKLLDLTFRATENGIAQTAMLADFTKKFKQLNISFDSTSSYASIKLYEYIPATDSYNSIGTVSPNAGYQTIVIPATVDTRHLQMRFVISTALADKTYDFRNIKINAFYRYISDLETRNSTGTTQGTLANIVDLTNVDFKGFTGSFAGNTATITAANEDVPCWFRLYGFQYRDISKLSMSFICSASSHIAVYGITLDGTRNYIGVINNSPDTGNINTQVVDIPTGYEQIYFQFELANVQNTAYVVSNILMSVEYRDTYAAPAAFSTILTADVSETADARVPYKVISVKTAGNIDLINNTISGSLDGSATPAEVVQIVPNNSNNINNFNDYISMIIDLGGSNTVDKIIPYFEYEDTTYYKYRLEVSGDGNNWFTVFDNIKMAHEELPVLIPLTNAGNYTLYEALHKIIIPTWFTYPADFSNRRKVRYIKVISLTSDEFAVNRETMEPLTTERHLSISELRVYSGADDLTYSIIDYVENEGRNPLALMRNGQFEHKLTEGAYFVNSNRDQNDVSFTVDLGGINYITRIDIFAGNNKTWYKYRVLISTDKVNWEQIKENVTAPVRAYEG